MERRTSSESGSPTPPVWLFTTTSLPNRKRVTQQPLSVVGTSSSTDRKDVRRRQQHRGPQQEVALLPQDGGRSPRAAVAVCFVPERTILLTMESMTVV